MADARQLSGSDAAFLYLEMPHMPMVVGLLGVYDPVTAPGQQVSPSDVALHIAGQLHVSPLLRQRLARVPMGMDHPYWVDDPVFDLSDHVSHLRLPPPGDWQTLCRLAAKTLSRPMDLASPPWDVTIIEGLEGITGAPPGAFALLWRIHHSAADAFTAQDLISALHTAEPVAPAPPRADWQAAPGPDQLDVMTRAKDRAQNMPMAALDYVRRMAPRYGEAVQSLGPGGIEARLNAPHTPFQVSVSSKRTLCARTFSLETAELVRRAVPGTSLNDVFLTVIARGLRLYLLRKGILPDRPLQAALPLSLRPPGDTALTGNRLTAGLIDLATVHDDPLACLAAIHTSVRQTRSLLMALGPRDSAELIDLIPPPSLSMAARALGEFGMASQVAKAINTIIATVRGSRHALYCAGARCAVSFVAMPVADGVGLAHGVNTYGAGFTITATACRELLPDPEQYAEALAEAFDDLQTAAFRAGAGYAPAALLGSPDDDWRDLEMVDYPFGADVEKLLDRMQAGMESLKDSLRRSSAAFDQNQRKMSNLVLAQAEENLRATFDAMRVTMSAKDPQTAMKAQGEALRGAFERSLAQVRELAQLVENSQDAMAANAMGGANMGMFNPALRSASDFFAQLRNMSGRIVPDDVSNQLERYLDSMQDAMNEMRENLRDVRTNVDSSQQQMMALVLTHARENLDKTYETLNQIVGSKEPNEAMRTQAAALQDAIERAVSQTRQVNALLSDNTQAAFAPVRDFYSQLGTSSDFFARLGNSAGNYGFPNMGSTGAMPNLGSMGSMNQADAQKVVDAMQANMRDLQTALQKSSATMSESQREIAELLMAHARENMEESMRALQGVAQSGDIAESLRLQGTALRDSLERNMRQIREVTEKVSSGSQDAMKPLGEFFEQLRKASEALASLTPFDPNKK